MNFSEIEASIEALLFSMGKEIKIRELAQVLEISEKDVDSVVDIMANKYEEEGRGLTIIKLENSVQMATKKKYYEYIKKLNNKVKDYSLTPVHIETLAIIAYKQPVTRGMVEEIRGVNSTHAINKLIEYNLVEEVGRLDAPGRPFLFGTTKDFLRGFGIKDVDELPKISEEKLKEIEEEVGVSSDENTETTSE